LIVAQLKSDSLNLSSVYKSIIFFELYIWLRLDDYQCLSAWICQQPDCSEFNFDKKD
jgi:hypothetical protein